ncbi:MAG: hypothetical protein JWO36_3873 [Myxococcales bacterium]|nr:hypothetical protein [Myxococcales bacterium]
MRAVFCAVVCLSGCYAPAYEDCQISCAGNVCPSGLSCVAGMCRSGGASGVCGQGNRDGGVDAVVRDGSPSDVDGDGIPNTSDNCPTKSNANQADEDNDTLGDVCDPCPWSGTTADNHDSDGDGVGDGCDPRPNVVGDRIVLFEGFAGGVLPPGAMAVGPWMFSGGTASTVSGPQSTLVWPIPITSAETVFAHGTLDQVTNGKGDVEVLDAFEVANARGIGCSIGWPSGAVQPLMFLLDTGPNVVLSSMQMTAPLGIQTTFRIDRTAMGFQCKTIPQPNTVIVANGPMAASPNAGFRVRTATAHFDWIAVVTSQ